MIKREVMLECRNVVGKKPMFYRIDDLEGIDVDNQIDFDFAEFIYNRN